MWPTTQRNHVNALSDICSDLHQILLEDANSVLEGSLAWIYHSSARGSIKNNIHMLHLKCSACVATGVHGGLILRVTCEQEERWMGIV